MSNSVEIQPDHEFLACLPSVQGNFLGETFPLETTLPAARERIEVKYTGNLLDEYCVEL